MEALHGKDFGLYVQVMVDGEPHMQQVVCATSMTITFAQDIKEATKPSSSRNRVYYTGMLSYTISLDGLYVVDDEGKKVSARFLYENLVSGSELLWFANDISRPEQYYSGYVLQESLSMTSPADSGHNFSVSFRGTGGIEIVNPYQTIVYGDVPIEQIYNEEGILIGYQDTGGMPPVDH